MLYKNACKVIALVCLLDLPHLALWPLGSRLSTEMCLFRKNFEVATKKETFFPDEQKIGTKTKKSLSQTFLEEDEIKRKKPWVFATIALSLAISLSSDYETD